MNKIKIYLAGKMSRLSFENMNSWREIATKIFHYYSEEIHIENPCKYYNPVTHKGTYTEKEAKEFDLYLVKNCDVVLVNLDFSDSIGTAIECHEGHDNWSKPVVGFGTREDVHPWLLLSLTKRCETMEDAIDHILSFYIPNI